VDDNIINDTKTHPSTSLVISITTGMQWCNGGRTPPLEHIPGFTTSHWMLSSGKCLHCIAVAATMGDDFGEKHGMLTKTISS
jgi:hypothetical protein